MSLDKPLLNAVPEEGKEISSNNDASSQERRMMVSPPRPSRVLRSYVSIFFENVSRLTIPITSNSQIQLRDFYNLDREENDTTILQTFVPHAGEISRVQTICQKEKTRESVESRREIYVF